MALSTSQANAYSQSSYITFTAAQFLLPNYTLNLIDTAGFVRFAVNGQMTVFEGSDPVFGTMAPIGAIPQTMASESSRLDITILPPTAEALGSLCQPNIQGCQVRVYEGVVHPETGAVIGTPYQTWNGFIDTPTVTISESKRTVVLSTATVIERFLMPDEGARLTPVWQQLHFPGQIGLAFNVDATVVPNWGKEGISQAFGGSTAIGGGNGGGTTYGGGGGGGYSGGGGGGRGGGFDMDTYIY